ncbi:DUF2510 domain-containing protein [Rhodococcus pyridinivorans]|uniref:DUF2510 domain-containing protein n=1 Tax=Rhodococcus pyridinivorans TaxID=103816 RepID=UPI0039B6181B
MGQTSEDFPLDRVNSIQWTTGWLAGSVTIFAGGNAAQIRLVVKEDGAAFADRVRTVIASSGGVHAPSGRDQDGDAAPSTPVPPPPVAPAGWYPDPQNGVLQRYWDGTRWSERTAPLTPPPR